MTEILTRTNIPVPVWAASMALALTGTPDTPESVAVPEAIIRRAAHWSPGNPPRFPCPAAVHHLPKESPCTH